MTNEGTITARIGTIALGAGGQATVELLGDGLVELVIDASVAGALVENSGTLTANSGLVALHAGKADDWLGAVLNQTGSIDTLTVDARDGRIVLTGGDVQLGGTLDATGEIDVHGGEITVSALSVHADTAFNLRSDGDVTFVGTFASLVDGDDSAVVVLRADAHGTGSGTVVRSGGASLAVNGAEVKIFYNPDDPGNGNHRYTNPTTYTELLVGASKSTAHMLVNNVEA